MKRLSNFSSFIVMDILQKASLLDDVVHMEIGEPDLEPSPKVIQALEKAIKDKKFYYTSSLGLPELREAISQHYWNYYGIDVSPERIAITVGTSGAFLVAYSIVMDFGDKVALADPSYPCYKNFAYMLGIEPVFVPVDESTNYQITFDMLRDLDNIKALHISSPSNPTGTLYDDKTLRDLCDFCESRGIYLISDEIYHGLVYEKRERTVLEFFDKAIVINGFSKFFCMPGFRLGWMVLPQELVRKAEIVLQNLYISAPTLSQYAAIHAFDYEHLKNVKSVFKRRRDTLYQGIKEVFDIKAKPEGAFYIWASIEKYSENSYAFCMDLLEKTKVAITPGIDFGKNNTKKHIRLAYTKDEKVLLEGIRRIRHYVEELKREFHKSNP